MATLADLEALTRGDARYTSELARIHSGLESLVYRARMLRDDVFFFESDTGHLDVAHAHACALADSLAEVLTAIGGPRQ